MSIRRLATLSLYVGIVILRATKTLLFKTFRTFSLHEIGVARWYI
jgi:hypothetical protein